VLHVTVLTLFPEMLSGALTGSILGRAQTQGVLSVRLVNIRDYAGGRHGQVDDAPYGGGPGMVMKPDVVQRALAASVVDRPPGHVVFFTPQGRRFAQQDARRLAGCDHLVLVCGHYEGVDERFVGCCVDEELSIGDFVLTGGEIPALAVIDAVARMLPGVVGTRESVEQDSFAHGLLDHPHYTRPVEWQGYPVPGVLCSGHHGAIAAWRRRHALLRTLLRRPDLLPSALLEKAERTVLGALALALDEMMEERDEMGQTGHGVCTGQYQEGN
jgi:tRNA (guanine37-N1)-methyltransferase